MEKDKILKLLALKEEKTNKQILEIVRTPEDIDKITIETKKYANILEICRKDEIKIVTYFDKEYPQKLKAISTSPVILFAKGNLTLLKKPSISIVGTRKASKKVLDWTLEASKELSKTSVIISGGAIGIDSQSHIGAKETICVLGSGLNKIYPKENELLIKSIMKKGLVISELLPDNKGNEFSLLERNRITSALGDKILIVSSDIKGGTMSQYKIAVSQKKDIYCPDPKLELFPNEGIIKIISEGKNIKIIINADDILKSKISLESQKPLETFT